MSNRMIRAACAALPSPALVLLVPLAPFVLVGCASIRAGDHHYFHKAERPHAAEWGYEGAIGPEHWGDLCPDYAPASTGRRQSPIDIHGAAPQDLSAVEFRYRPAEIDVVYNGHTVEEKEDLRSSVVIDGAEYTLEQFHFHSPSEHTVGGEHSDMEMHLVHKSAKHDVAVVAVLIEEGTENAAFAPVWNNLPDASRTERHSKATVDAGAMLPADRRHYRYDGSFTTPPCTEGVLWVVLLEPVALSEGQIAQFRAVIEGNNRPVQPLNGRTIAVSR